VIQRRRCLPGTRHSPISANAEVAKGQVEPWPATAAVVDAVWMLSVELADEPPGVMEPGLNVAMALVVVSRIRIGASGTSLHASHLQDLSEERRNALRGAVEISNFPA